jgi:hypothetical protein
LCIAIGCIRASGLDSISGLLRGCGLGKNLMFVCSLPQIGGRKIRAYFDLISRRFLTTSKTTLNQVQSQDCPPGSTNSPRHPATNILLPPTFHLSIYIHYPPPVPSPTNQIFICKQQQLHTSSSFLQLLEMARTKQTARKLSLS